MDPTPVRFLDEVGINYLINTISRKLREDELGDLIVDNNVVIVGAEPITNDVTAITSRLKLVSLIGIGLDSANLNPARRRGVRTPYAPDVPAKVVSDLTLGCPRVLVTTFARTGIWKLHSGLNGSTRNGSTGKGV